MERRKFALTSQLIKLAMNDGWKQKDIAEACRTTQPTVSKWRNGSAKAYEDQLKKLLDIYGPRLRRKAHRLYQSYESDEGRITYTRIEGRVLMDESYDRVPVASDKRRSAVTQRLVLHDIGKGRFLVVQLDRLMTPGNEDPLLDGSSNSAWVATITDPMSIDELVKRVDAYTNNLDDALSAVGWHLRFSVRKALLDHGYPVEGVTRLDSGW